MKLLEKLLNKYFIIYRYKNRISIGDHFLITAILQKIREKYRREILVFTIYPDLFLNNPNVYMVINYQNPTNENNNFLFNNTIFENDADSGMSLLMNKLVKIKNKFIHEFEYPWMISKNSHVKKSLVDFYSFGLDIDTHNCLPEIYLSNNEKLYFSAKFKLPLKYYLVHSHGVTDWKNYDINHMQKIISETCHKINWIQIGLKNDVRLYDIVDDLCGKLTLRELFCSVFYCDAILSIHGFQTLIATAFNKKNYCIISDYQYPEQTPYSNIINIRSTICHDDPCTICNCWGCGCQCPYKKQWKENINPAKIIELLLNDIK